MSEKEQMSFENENKPVNCFGLLTTEEQDFLNEKKTQLLYNEKENIFKQGAFAPYVMYIVDGLVKIYIQTGKTKKINIGVAKTGDFLGFSTVFGDKIYKYSTIALKDSKICMFDKDAVKLTLSRNVQFAMQITSKNFRNENHLLDIIENISYKQMRGKLASSLLYLSSEEFLKENIFLYLSRHDIADFASISPESTIKFLKEFEKEGILLLKGKDIIVQDKKKLIEISKYG